MRIKISTDSTCDLPEELIKKYDIGVLPLYIIHGDHTYRDGFDITPEKIIDIAESGGGACTTAAVSVSDYITAFSAYRREYDAVIHLTISESMSACLQNARLAAKEIDGVFPIDSRNLSSGIGLLALRAAEYAQSGMTAGEVVGKLESLRGDIETSFVIEKLDYVRRGGRCSAITSFGANLLGLKPCLEMRDSEICVGKKYRGSYEKALLEYVKDRLTGRKDIDLDCVFLTHSPTDAALVQKVYDAVKNAMPLGEIIVNEASCTIANHCGPNTLGVLFFRKPRG